MLQTRSVAILQCLLIETDLPNPFNSRSVDGDKRCLRIQSRQFWQQVLSLRVLQSQPQRLQTLVQALAYTLAVVMDMAYTQHANTGKKVTEAIVSMVSVMASDTLLVVHAVP
jgi:hypothetical protein